MCVCVCVCELIALLLCKLIIVNNDFYSTKGLVCIYPYTCKSPLHALVTHSYMYMYILKASFFFKGCTKLARTYFYIPRCLLSHVLFQLIVFSLVPMYTLQHFIYAVVEQLWLSHQCYLFLCWLRMPFGSVKHFSRMWSIVLATCINCEYLLQQV